MMIQQVYGWAEVLIQFLYSNIIGIKVENYWVVMPNSSPWAMMRNGLNLVPTISELLIDNIISVAHEPYPKLWPKSCYLISTYSVKGIGKLLAALDR